MKKSNIYVKFLINLILALLVLVLIFFIVPKLISFFLPFVIGWIIAMIVNPLAKILEKRLKLSRKYGFAIIITLIIVLVVWGVYFTISYVVSQTIGLISDLPNIYVEIDKQITLAAGKLIGIYDILPAEAQKFVLNIADNSEKYITSIIGNLTTFNFNAASITKNVSNGFVAFIVTVMSSYFFVSERKDIEKLIVDITPVSVKEKYTFIMDTLKTTVGGYFKAQFKIMLVIFMIIFVGFAILGVNYALLLALLISIFDFLPVFGAGAVLIPWAIIELLSGSIQGAIGFGIIYLVCLVVRQAIQPKMVGDSIGLNPLPTLIFMYVGMKLKGIVGMILGIPIGMILINLYNAGMFDGAINVTKTMINHINDYRKM